MSACWRCGKSTPSGAAFCPACGTELRTELPEFELLTEPGVVGEPTHVEATAADPSRWVIVAAIAVVGGLVAFFTLVGGDEDEGLPSADPFEDRADFDAVEVPDRDGSSTTTETEPDDSAVDSLDWAVAVDEGDGVPLAFVQLDDATYLYTVDAATVWAGGSDLRAWERSPTGRWTDRGPVLDPAAVVNAVAESDQGLIATGVDADGAPTLWRSNDGLTWAAESLPPIGGGSDAVLPQFVADAGGVTVVAGAAVNPWARIQLAIEERFGADAIHARAEVDDMSSVVTVRGPFGFVMGEIELADLGMAATELTVYFERPSSIWERSGDGAWTTATAGGIVLNLFATDDGRIARNVGNNFGSTVSFRDSTGWSEPAEPGRLWQVQPWNGDLVGRDERGSVSVLSTDLAETRRLTLPNTDGVYDLAGTEAGLAVAQVEVDPGHEDKERVVVLRDGFTLTAEAGIITLSEGNDVIHRGSLHWERSRDRYRVDTLDDRQVVTFLGDGGEDLVAFTLDELATLQDATEWGGRSRPILSVFATTDGETWAGGTVDADGIDGVGFGRLHVVDGRVIAALSDDPLGSPGDGTDRFVILEAALPD